MTVDCCCYFFSNSRVREGHKDAEKAGTPQRQRQAERVGVIQEKRMLQEDLTEVFQYLKRVEKKREKDFLHGQVVTGQGTMVLN